MNATSFRKYLIIVLISFSATAVGNNHARSSISASSIDVDIEAHGAKAVVAALWENNERWNEVITNIGHGSSEWLNIAVKLHPGTDAGSAELLDEAVFLALKPSPIAVLQLLRDQQFSIDFVCSSNISTDYPPDQARRFIRERIKILRDTSDVETDSVRLQCISRLRAAMKYIN